MVRYRIKTDLENLRFQSETRIKDAVALVIYNGDEKSIRTANRKLPPLSEA